jgi:hypothetical protein
MIDCAMVSQIVFTVVINTVFMGILVFAAQKHIEQRLNRSLEEFKADLQLAVSERRSWWELKKTTYSEIMNSLVNLRSCLEGWLDDLYEKKVLDAKSKTELNAAYLQAKEHLKKVVAIGPYIVSEDTVVTLEELLACLDECYPSSMNPSLYETRHIHHNVVKNSIARIRDYAKADLHQH